MTSQELVLELQQILKEEYGLDLPYEKVVRIGKFILSYFETLLSIETNKNKNKNGN